MITNKQTNKQTNKHILLLLIMLLAICVSIPIVNAVPINANMTEGGAADHSGGSGKNKGGKNGGGGGTTPAPAPTPTTPTQPTTPTNPKPTTPTNPDPPKDSTGGKGKTDTFEDPCESHPNRIGCRDDGGGNDWNHNPNPGHDDGGGGGGNSNQNCHYEPYIDTEPVYTTFCNSRPRENESKYIDYFSNCKTIVRPETGDCEYCFSRTVYR